MRLGEAGGFCSDRRARRKRERAINPIGEAAANTSGHRVKANWIDRYQETRQLILDDG
jgi:hypothetical protein